MSKLRIQTINLEESLYIEARFFFSYGIGLALVYFLQYPNSHQNPP